MFNLEKEINEYLEEVEEKEEWEIKSDEDAEWWIEKKAENLAEVRRYKISIENKINLLKEKLDKAKNEEKNILANRDFYLQKYFETIDEKQLKKTKTQEKYRLPSLDLVKNIRGPEYIRKEKELVEWLEKTKALDYIKTKKTSNWGELKKEITVENNIITDEEGNILRDIKPYDEDKITFLNINSGEVLDTGEFIFHERAIVYREKVIEGVEVEERPAEFKVVE